MQNAAEHYICKGGKKIGEEEKGREIGEENWGRGRGGGGEKTGGMICVRRKLKF